MRTAIIEMLGIDAPVFAFSHCRDVVAAISKVGGMGVLGAAQMMSEHREQELKQIDEHVDGKSYGVNMVFTSTAKDVSQDKSPRQILPREQVDYINRLMSADGVPPQHVIDLIKGVGIKLGRIVGAGHHAQKNAKAGADFMIA